MRRKELFLFIVGITPQIVTETIYALIHKNPPIHPDRILIITTSTGKDKLEKELIKSGRLEAFFKEFKLKTVAPEIMVIKNGKGEPLDDIKTYADNEDTGDFITSIVEKLTEDKGVRLHCSLAGGRKTMGFYLGSALSFFGRPWDKLYHVLVNPEFESHPDFYWKPKKNKTIEARLPDGSIRRINTRDASIQLAELPFIRLGEKFSIKKKGFRELVKEGQRELDIAHVQTDLVLNLKTRTITIGDISIKMEPLQIFLYTALLRRKTDYCKQPKRKSCDGCTDCFERPDDILSKDNIENFKQDYISIYNQPKWDDFLHKRKENGFDALTIRSKRSKINKKIKKHIGSKFISYHYIIDSYKKTWGEYKYGIRIDKSKIKIVP